MLPASSSSRSARRRSWSGDSSPDTYRVDTPWLSSRAAHCMSSVDLPMPGSPPTSVTEPGTMPPPRTKSNSARPVFQRAMADCLRSVRRIGGWPVGAPLTAEPLNRPTASSTSEFHAPQLSQRPPHFGWSAPHSVQRKTDLPLDTDRSLARGVVVEARVFLLEVQLHGARRPVALLAHDHLGEAFDALVGFGIHRAVVELLTVDEAHHVGILLDRARFPEVGELRPPVLAAALLRRARELRDRDPRHVELLGECLQRTGDVGDLLLAVLDVARPLHELQVVHDHERNIVLGLQPPCLRAHGERRQGGGIVNPDRRGAEQTRRARELGVIIVAQLAAAQPLCVYQPLRAEQPLHELVLGHFEREERDPGVVLDGGVLHDVQRQRRLPHRGSSGQDDQVGALEARGVPIEIDEPARDAGQRAGDRKSTRLNSSHSSISYAVFCLKKKTKPILRKFYPTNSTSPLVKL